MTWNPRRSLTEVEALLTSPGTLHHVSTALIDGRLQRVYKNLWPSLSQFWLSAVSQYPEDTYVVYEHNRWTYRQVHRRALDLAIVFVRKYNIRKGDRVAICSRNSPEYLVAFWACHLIGAVSVLMNAWLPLNHLSHCLVHTECKLAILDPERADLLQPLSGQLLQTSIIKSFLVFDLSQPRKRRRFMHSLDEILENHREDHVCPPKVFIGPEDNATIIFTSGTTGLPKGVLSTQRQFLTNVLNVLVGGFRAALRRGEDLPSLKRSIPQKAALVNVPLFHVTGLTSYSMMATMTGMKIVLMRRWDVTEASRLIRTENVSIAGGVPSMVTDLTTSDLLGHPLEILLFGGAPAPDTLVQRAREAFPKAVLTQGYGLTETNSIAVSFAGEDYMMRPASTGLSSPVNEIQIVRNGLCLPPNTVGEVWIRGPNVMKCYWRDPEATKASLTQDGWLKSGDIGYTNEEGFLYIKDRIKDIIIRGGENIPSVLVENAFYADPRILDAAAVGIPDERLGELVVAIVSLRHRSDEGQKGLPSSELEESLISQVRARLPHFAVPVMIVIKQTPFDRTPSGKVIKNDLRKLARAEWERRQQICRGHREFSENCPMLRASL